MKYSTFVMHAGKSELYSSSAQAVLRQLHMSTHVTHVTEHGPGYTKKRTRASFILAAKKEGIQ